VYCLFPTQHACTLRNATQTEATPLRSTVQIGEAAFAIVLIHKPDLTVIVFEHYSSFGSA
jgi:hypothetical protein